MGTHKNQKIVLAGLSVKDFAIKYNRSTYKVYKELAKGYCVVSRNSAGAYKHPLYKTWQMMLDRCYNPNTPSYINYGGRDIRVCPEWFYSFDKFFEDMDAPPTTQHTLDRIDNNGPYSPENCRWATKSTQGRNKAPQSDSGYIGVHYNKLEKKYKAAATNDAGVRAHIGTFQYPEDAAKARDEYLTSVGIFEGLNFPEEYERLPQEAMEWRKA